MERKFKALQTISVIFKVIAWIMGVAGVIGFIVMLIIGAALPRYAGYGTPFGALGAFSGIGMAFYILIMAVISFISFYAAAELILVILAIEENTRGQKPQV